MAGYRGIATGQVKLRHRKMGPYDFAIRATFAERSGKEKRRDVSCSVVATLWTARVARFPNRAKAIW